MPPLSIPPASPSAQPPLSCSLCPRFYPSFPYVLHFTVLFVRGQRPGQHPHAIKMTKVPCISFRDEQLRRVGGRAKQNHHHHRDGERPSNDVEGST
eukprot:3321465-Rhodomonas_salina.3